MARVRRPPSWFILEYLSAEAWVEDTHGLPRRIRAWRCRAGSGFPGFTPNTGGLLRERGLLEARDAFRRDATAQRAFWSSLARAAGRGGRNPRLAVLLSEPGAAGAARRLGRRRRARDVPRARRASPPARSTPGPAATVPPPGALVRARPAVRRRDSVPDAGPIRPAAVALQRQFRPRRGLVRPRAVGGACFRVAHLPAGRGRALAQARRLPRALHGGARPRRGGGAAPVLAGVERRAACPPIGAAWLEFAAARPHLDRHAAAWSAQLAALPEPRRAGASGPGVEYN